MKRQIESLFHVSNSKRFMPVALAIAILAIVSCRSPIFQGKERGAIGFTFLISGNSMASRATISGSYDGTSSRLLLPTVDRLTVTLTPDDASIAAPEPQTVTVATDMTAVPVPFVGILFGTYTVKAQAYLESAPTEILFEQTASGMAITAEAGALTLNLVPTNPAAVPSAMDTSIAITSIPAGSSLTWLIPAESRLIEGDYLLMAGGGAGTGVKAFIQSTVDGSLLGSFDDIDRISTDSFVASQSCYLTLYNSSALARTLSVSASLVMVAVPAGTFQRDATATNTSYVSAFSMGKYEVTQAQYEAVLGINPSLNKVPGNPVEYMTWYDAVEFCNMLSALESLELVYGITDISRTGNSITDAAVTADWTKAGYRLPTEMEWMWAAMGADTASPGATNTTGYNKAFAGNTGSIIGDNVWYNPTSSSSTHPVGTKMANELGLYDMSGNVWEWNWDWTGTYPTDAVTNYLGAASGTYRVGRGGSYNSAAGSVSVAFRYSTLSPSTPQSFLGFRVARNAQPLFSVVYDGNGSTSGTIPTDANYYQAGSAATVLANTGTLLKTGSAFAGWNTQADGNGIDCMPWGGTAAVNGANVTLYAKWIGDYTATNVGTLKAIPIGSFQRDATATNITRIRQAYRMSATEITRTQWTAVTGWIDPSSAGYSTGPGDPVQQVNWYHAIAFCNKLSLLEGLTPVYSVSVSGLPVNFSILPYASIPISTNADWNAATADWSANGYRLPTEMEWVWAAMGATSDTRSGDIIAGVNTGGYTKGYSGSTETSSAYINIANYAWYDLNCVDPQNKTHPAGSKTVNELGLYDMSGNVCEWMWDPYSSILPTGLVDSDSAAGRGLGAVTYRVKTGGSWNYPYNWCAVAFRINESPYAPGASVGFRVVRP